MTGNPLRKMISSAVRSGLDPSLRELKFTKEGSHYRRWHAEYCCCIYVQLSQWNNRQKSTFTLDLGVFYPKLAECRGEVAQDKPTTAYCQLRERIGHLTIGRDLWWTVEPSTDEVALAEELRGSVPPIEKWFSQTPSLGDLPASLEATENYWLAAIAYQAIGKSQDAERLLPLALKTVPVIAEYVQQWAERHGLGGTARRPI
jgi:hypothetical protein